MNDFYLGKELGRNFTRIPHTVLELLAAGHLPAEALRVLCVILRKTLGFNKPLDRISYSQFTEATGMKRTNVFRSLKRLQAANVITRSGTGHKIFYGLNFEYQSWNLAASSITLSKSDHSDINLTAEPSSGSQHTIDTKNTSTKDKCVHHIKLNSIMEFWKAEYHKAFGLTYVLAKGKEKESLQELAEDLGERLVKRMIMLFFSERNTWVARGPGYTIDAFLRLVNRLAQKARLEVRDDGNKKDCKRYGKVGPVDV